jgi:hypothetical protein
VKITALDLQRDPAQPALHFHRVEQSRDQNFWSVRVSDNLRIILRKTSSSAMLCYVGHHDNAYQCAERRCIEQHPVTGAAQFVEIPTTIAPESRFQLRTIAPSKPSLFAKVSDQQLLGYGVPVDWLGEAALSQNSSYICAILRWYEGTHSGGSVR